MSRYYIKEKVHKFEEGWGKRIIDNIIYGSPIERAIREQVDYMERGLLSKKEFAINIINLKRKNAQKTKTS